VAHESLQTIDVHASTKRNLGNGTTEGVQRRRLDASSFGAAADKLTQSPIGQTLAFIGAELAGRSVAFLVDSDQFTHSLRPDKYYAALAAFPLADMQCPFWLQVGHV
jgi:hypothetical protein